MKKPSSSNQSTSPKTVVANLKSNNNNNSNNKNKNNQTIELLQKEKPPVVFQLLDNNNNNDKQGKFNIASIGVGIGSNQRKETSSHQRQQSTLTNNNNQGQRKKKIYEENDEDSELLDSCNIFVKYLPQHLNDKDLENLFKPFGEIVSCKVMTDKLRDNISLGFGFVRFSNEKEAKEAIQQMNGFEIENKKLLCKLSNSSSKQQQQQNNNNQQLLLKEVQTNLFIRNIPMDYNEEKLRKVFESFGTVSGVKIIIDNNQQSKGYGFCKFEKREDALKAIQGLNGMKLEKDEKKVSDEDTNKQQQQQEEEEETLPLVVRFAETEQEKQKRKLLKSKNIKQQQYNNNHNNEEDYHLLDGNHEEMNEKNYDMNVSSNNGSNTSGSNNHSGIAGSSNVNNNSVGGNITPNNGFGNIQHFHSPYPIFPQHPMLFGIPPNTTSSPSPTSQNAAEFNASTMTFPTNYTIPPIPFPNMTPIHSNNNNQDENNEQNNKDDNNEGSSNSSQKTGENSELQNSQHQTPYPPEMMHHYPHLAYYPPMLPHPIPMQMQNSHLMNGGEQHKEKNEENKDDTLKQQENESQPPSFIPHGFPYYNPYFYPPHLPPHIAQQYFATIPSFDNTMIPNNKVNEQSKTDMDTQNQATQTTANTNNNNGMGDGIIDENNKLNGSSDEGANLFIFHLPVDVDDPKLFALFCKFGTIESVKVIRDQRTGYSKGYGFVKFHKFEDAVKAITEMDKFKIGKKHLKVSFKTGSMPTNENMNQGNSNNTSNTKKEKQTQATTDKQYRIFTKNSSQNGALRENDNTTKKDTGNNNNNTTTNSNNNEKKKR
ncbi:hypothetical protein ABK040_006110 [Willaertia magna]